VSFLRAWMIRGGWLGTKLFMLGPNGEVYTRFHLYSLDDGYTKSTWVSQVPVHRMKDRDVTEK